MTKSELIFTRRGSDIPSPFENPLLEKTIRDKYNFICGYAPEGYNVVLLLQKDDREDSRNDQWKIIIYKERKKIAGTVTLDNIENFVSTAENEIEVLKEIDCNFEEVIETSVDLIRKSLARAKKIEDAS